MQHLKTATANEKRFRYIILAAYFLLSAFQSKAQKLDTVSTFSISGYVDAYYGYYTDSVGAGNLQKFAFSSPRSNSPSLNIAQLSFMYTADRIRATAVFYFGDIAAASPIPGNNIMEAHVGFKIYSKLWIDAGFFRSHFGTEFLLPYEGITSSLAVGSYYEPLFESGIRLDFNPITKLDINLFLLNGYDMFVDNNNKKSYGAGVTYAINDDLGIGYTNYIGDDTPPTISTNHLRTDQNVFLNYQHKKIRVQVGSDYCLQRNSDIETESKTAAMYSALATFRYQAFKKFAVYTRGEIFRDPNGFISTIFTDIAGNQTGYKLWGIMAGLEYKPTQESYIRLEGRRLQMDKDQYIFDYNGSLYNYRYELVVNAGVTFDLLKSVRTRLTTPEPEKGADD